MAELSGLSFSCRSGFWCVPTTSVWLHELINFRALPCRLDALRLPVPGLDIGSVSRIRGWRRTASRPAVNARRPPSSVSNGFGRSRVLRGDLLRVLPRHAVRAFHRRRQGSPSVEQHSLFGTWMLCSPARSLPCHSCLRTTRAENFPIPCLQPRHFCGRRTAWGRALDMLCDGARASVSGLGRKP